MVELDAYLAENDGLRTSVELCALHQMIYSAEVHAGRAPSFAAKFVVWNMWHFTKGDVTLSLAKGSSLFVGLPTNNLR